jgi:iron-sulfur cluster assembly protein
MTDATVTTPPTGERTPSEAQEAKKVPITLTPAAVEAARAALAKRGTPQAAIRLGIKGGGCSGFSYVIEYEDEEPRTRDRTFEVEGVRIVVDKKSLIYLMGTVLDFEKTLMKQGFKFRNPNEATSCSCGTSFTVK